MEAQGIRSWTALATRLFSFKQLSLLTFALKKSSLYTNGEAITYILESKIGQQPRNR